jgi:predicted phosphodiesterase
MPKRNRSRFILPIGIVLLVVSVILMILAQGATSWDDAQHIAGQTFRQARSLVARAIGQPSLSGVPEPRLVKYKFAIIADSHEDTTYFPQISSKIAKKEDIAFVVHLGDLSNAGDLDKLTEARRVLDQISAPVYILPGDHDLNWVPRHDLQNFRQVFGQKQTYRSFDYEQEHFILIDNSNLNQGIDLDQWQWLESDLQANRQRNIYVFMSTPISNPYISFKRMGSQNETVANQANKLGRLLADAGVKAIFAGDTHAFSQYNDKQTGLSIVTAGSAGSTKNPLPQHLQVDILADGGYNVSSIPQGKAIPVQGTD